MRRLQWTRGTLWLALGMVLWCCSVSALITREGLWNDRRISYRLQSGGASLDNMVSLRREMNEMNGGEVAAWAQSISQSISASDMDGSAMVDVLWIDGDASLVWNLPAVRGTLPGYGDDEGCAIDEGTALSLYGSLEAVGRTIAVAGNDLMIRGVFTPVGGLTAYGVDPGRGLALCAAASGPENLSLSAMEFLVKVDAAKNATDQVKEWMRAASISTSGDMDDHMDQRNLLTILVTIPAYLLAFFALVELWSAVRVLSGWGLVIWRSMRLDRLTPVKRYRHLAVAWIMGLLLLAGFAMLTVFLAPSIRSIPAAYLPTRWSDFSFWSDLIKGNWQADAQHAMSVALRPDMVWDRLADWCVVLIAGAVACLWHGKSVLKRNAGNTGLLAVFLHGGLICVAALFAVWVAGRAGWTPAAPLEALALPALLYGFIAAFRAGRVPKRWLSRFFIERSTL